MANRLRNVEIAITRRLGRKPPSGFVARSAFWLALLVAAMLVLRVSHLWRGDNPDALIILACIPLSIFLLILLWRWTFRYLLWRVRNRLIVTYLLMGLAPVVLFVTLAAIAAYLFSGQFATYAANAELNSKLARITAEDHAFATHIGHVIAVNPKVPAIDLPEYQEEASGELDPASFDVGVEVDGQALNLVSAGRHMPSSVATPAWLTTDFHGFVLDHDKLFFRAADQATITDAQGNLHHVTVHTSLPFSEAMLVQMADKLGRVSVLQAFDFQDDEDDPPSRHHPHVVVVKRGPDIKEERHEFETLGGGRLRPPQHFYDRTVHFGAPLAVTDWRNGHTLSGMLLNVESRPTVLYQLLFGNSVQVAAIVRDVLITIGIIFGLLELFALAMAIGLSRTITRSIQDLYLATRAIDSGDLEHRIVVKRRDQLAALSTSFNTMAQSLAHLLEQQREKERLQTELAIAQEVQNSLLPQGQIRLPMLEVHGVSKPARSVSGDYYDFLLTGHVQLGLALGDISGKGISAALLMAGLHSAVRAYRYGENGVVGEELLAGDTNLLASPALMLERLNRHLYSSTQPEKYATLFLAHYDGADSSLTYATGGQLPPLVLCTSGEVKRLDCGGSVVGLIDGLKYEQSTVHLDAGDIVIIYSDGVTEPENEFGDFGEDRLLDLVRRNRTQSLEAISATIMQSLRTWIGDQEQPDDITLVLARQL